MLTLRLRSHLGEECRLLSVIRVDLVRHFDLRQHLSTSKRKTVVDAVEPVYGHLLYLRLKALGKLELDRGYDVLFLWLAHRVIEECCLVVELVELRPVHSLFDTRHDLGVGLEAAFLRGRDRQSVKSVRVVSCPVPLAKHRHMTVLLGSSERADGAVDG